jgi:hypothetical protein
MNDLDVEPIFFEKAVIRRDPNRTIGGGQRTIDYFDLRLLSRVRLNLTVSRNPIHQNNHEK